VSESFSLLGGDAVRLYTRVFECEGEAGLDDGRFGYRSKYLGEEASGDVCEEGALGT